MSLKIKTRSSNQSRLGDCVRTTRPKRSMALLSSRVFVGAALIQASLGYAQSPQEPGATTTPEKADSSVRPEPPGQEGPARRQVRPLAAKQEMVRDRFQRFADRVYRLREQLEAAEPDNAARLDRVLQRAGELGLADRLDEIMSLLDMPATQYRAVDAQAKWLADIDRLLAILMERDSLNAERERHLQKLESYRRRVDQLLQRQRGLRSATGGKPESPELGAQLDQAIQRLDALLEDQEKLSAEAKGVAEGRAGAQADVAAQALAEPQKALSQEGSKLAEELERMAKPQRDTDSEAPGEAAARQGIAQAAGKVQSGAQSMSQAAKGLQSGRAGSAGQSQQEAEEALREARKQLEEARRQVEERRDPEELAEEQQKLADETGALSEEMQRDAAGGQRGGQGGQQGSSSPGQQSLDNAQGEMQGASESLRQSAPDHAMPKQDRAIDELEKAQDELDEALQQLRQEEREETLRDLEARFRQMLSKQQAINKATERLDAIEKDNFRRAEELETADLSVRERALADDAATCLHILIEDGTTVAFPRVVEQLAEDMSTVSDRLAELRVGTLTQAIEREIVETLEQMLEAVQRMQQENEQQGMAGGQMSDGMAPLLPPSAELKLLRASQMRINQRTTVVESGLRESQGGDASEPGEPPDHLRRALEKIASRQQECAQIAQEMRDRQEQH